MPYTIQTPVDGQPISSSLYGIPVKNAITDLDLRTSFLEANLQRLVKRARRSTNSGTFTTTETPTLRLDNIPVIGGAAYRIMTSQLSVGSTDATSSVLIRLRYVFALTTGTVATISSTQLAAVRIFQDSASAVNTISLSGFYFPASSGYISLLISAIRVTGGGTLTFFGTGGDAYDLTVEFAGDDPGDTGVVL